MIFNVFRILGDASHVLSKIFLIWAIHWNRSAEGVSLITQVLYTLVFCTRYLDLFWTPILGPDSKFIYIWLFIFKIFYIATSFYIVFLMTRVYARTREREKAWKFGIYCFAAAMVLALPVTAIFQKGPVVGEDEEGRLVRMYRHPFVFSEILWTFSEILESVCVLPQLLLLRQTTVPTVLDSYYLLTLGAYRALYIPNWIVRYVDPKERHFDPIAVIFGIIQTALYVDFAWVYFSRQRVKLRAGGVVDSEDLSRGWLVGRLVGKHHDLEDGLEEEEGAVPARRHGAANGAASSGRKAWGKRGISVSADEGLRNEDAQPLTDPTAFEDLSDDEGVEDVAPPAESSSSSTGKTSRQETGVIHDADAVGDGSEWVDHEDEHGK